MEAAIAALLSQRNHDEAARECGVSKRTLSRWLKLPEFQAAFLEARRAVMSQVHARLQQAAIPAVTVLCKNMMNPTTPPAVQVRAAISILAQADQGLENDDVQLRLAALERAAQLSQTPRE